MRKRISNCVPEKLSDSESEMTSVVCIEAYATECNRSECDAGE